MNKTTKAMQQKNKHTLRNVILILISLSIVIAILYIFLSGKEKSVDAPTPTHTQKTLCIEGEPMKLGNLRDHYVDCESAQNAVIMLYMIGSDLESDDGSATEDLNEILEADLGNDVKIVVETGGSSVWHNDMMTAGENERWLITKNGIDFIENAGSSSMTEPQNLTDFIRFSKDTFDADRYILILWDHGGGTMGGFGFDEVNDNGGFTLTTLADAIRASDVQFDVIGFDACLMATIETAYALEPYADYLIASEETEPGYGWYYTDFLTEFGELVSMDSLELGRHIIDDYAQFYDNEDVTLSITELREVPYAYEQLSTFLTNAQDQIMADNKAFAMVSMARSKALEYNSCESDQIDIVDIVNRTNNIANKEQVIDAIQNCVKYRNNSSLVGSNGLAMYFPYREPDQYSDTEKILQQIHFDVPVPFYKYFLSIMSGAAAGQNVGQSPIKKDGYDFSSEDWYEDMQGEFDYENYNEELHLVETDDGFVLKLSEEDWDQITDTQIALMMEFENGYLDLGSDNITEVSVEGDLLIDYDGSWISIDDIPVAFYADKVYENSRGTIFSGTVNAKLNDSQMIELVLEWEPLTDEIASEEYELEGFIKGYRKVYDQTLTHEKGLRTLKQGDKIAFLYDYYDQDYNYIDTYQQSTITVESQDALQVGYTDISDKNVILWSILYDIYQQELNTETISIPSTN